MIAADLVCCGVDAANEDMDRVFKLPSTTHIGGGRSELTLREIWQRLNEARARRNIHPLHPLQTHEHTLVSPYETLHLRHLVLCNMEQLLERSSAFALLLSLSPSQSLSRNHLRHPLPRTTFCFFSPLPLPPIRLQLRSSSGDLCFPPIRTESACEFRYCSSTSHFISLTPSLNLRQMRRSSHSCKSDYAGIVQSPLEYCTQYTVILTVLHKRNHNQQSLTQAVARCNCSIGIGLNGLLWLT